MKFVKKTLSLACISALTFGFSAYANAADLNMSNDSKYDLSFSINNQCSKEFGVLESRSIKVISEKDFQKACDGNQQDCQATVYNAPDCNGKIIAVVGFNLTYGVQSLKPFGINLKGSGYNLFFEGPWVV